MGKTQKILIAKQLQEEHVRKIKRQKKIDQVLFQATWGIGVIIVVAAVSIMFAFVIEDRIKKYPQLGTGWIPKTEQQRKQDAEPKIYIGR